MASSKVIKTQTENDTCDRNGKKTDVDLLANVQTPSNKNDYCHVSLFQIILP